MLNHAGNAWCFGDGHEYPGNSAAAKQSARTHLECDDVTSDILSNQVLIVCCIQRADGPSKEVRSVSSDICSWNHHERQEGRNERVGSDLSWATEGAGVKKWSRDFMISFDRDQEDGDTGIQKSATLFGLTFSKE